MLRIYTLLFILHFSLGLYSQGGQVVVLIENMPDKMVYLSGFNKDEFKTVDSIKSANGSFYFHMESAAPVGIYRIELNRSANNEEKEENRFIDFIWNKETFQISADYRDIPGSVVFDNSEENRVFNEFKRYEQLYNQKFELIEAVIDHYPEEDEFYHQTGNKFVEIQQNRDKYILGLEEDYPELFATKIAVAHRAPIIPYTLNAMERLDFLKRHFFEKSPVNEPALLNAPVYNRQIIAYLMLYRGRDYTFSMQEEQFTTAVDIIMANVSGHPELRSFAVAYLLEGFESFGMEKLQTYIVDTYLDETCATDEVALAKERVEGYKKMAEGEFAEDILIRNASDEMVKLSEVPADYKLVIFWSSNCVHCKEMMPELKRWYKEERTDNIEIFAVSIDTSKLEWENYLSSNQLPWINTHEPMGWEGKSAEDYHIYATPTMFLLDRKLKIIARPYNLRQLKREFRRIY